MAADDREGVTEWVKVPDDSPITFTLSAPRNPSQPERDAIAATNQPSIALVAQLAMTYLATCPADEDPCADESDAVAQAVDSAYAILREIRRRGEVLDAVASAPVPPDKL